MITVDGKLLRVILMNTMMEGCGMERSLRLPPSQNIYTPSRLAEWYPTYLLIHAPLNGCNRHIPPIALAASPPPLSTVSPAPLSAFILPLPTPPSPTPILRATYL
jgi:hypothetical protein